MQDVTPDPPHSTFNDPLHKLAHTMNHVVNLNVYGITAQIITNDQEFHAFVKGNYTLFASEIVAEPNVAIYFSSESGNYARQKKCSMMRYGEGLYRDEKSLYWENEFGFAVFVDINDPMHWKLSGYHFDLIKDNCKEDQLKNYMRSMRWMIHFPLFSMLERFQGKRLVHASAVSKDGNAVILAGLNKVGKSSLGRHLYEHYAYKYLSDNFLLTDGERVYAFPEKGRLSPESLQNLNISVGSKQVIYGKHHVPIELEEIEVQAKPSFVFIIGNHQERDVIPIARERALMLLESLHRYLQEFPEYTFYSLLDSFEFRSRELNPLFSDQTRFFLLSFPLDWSIEKTTKEIIKCTSTT